MKPTQLYLASQSPRRAYLLTQIGLAFQIVHIDVDETVLPDEPVLEYVKRVAADKACAGWSHEQRIKSIPVLSADTVVVIDGHILGKPRNEAHGLQMLSQLSNRTHEVYTAVSVKLGPRIETIVSCSEVDMCEMSIANRQAYWQSGEGRDKAGCYALQGLGAVFVKKINGSHSGIMGLPLYECRLLLESFDIEVGVDSKNV